jgi:hypothetical protein
MRSFEPIDPGPPSDSAASEADFDEVDQENKRADQPYDAAMRRWAERNLPTVAGWLDSTVAGLPTTAFTQRPATFALPSVVADLLTTAGKDRLMHVEYETAPGKDLVTRMFNYRARIMSLYPKAHLTQYIIVLGNGRVRGYDDLRNGFTLDLRIIYLRDCDPAEFLKDPVLAPLAVLARGRRARRERSFSAALALIRDSGHPQSGELLQAAETLALIRLDAATIDRIRKENGMSIQPLVDHYRDTEVGQHLRRLGREEMLLAALRSQFGDRPEIPDVAKRLAGWPDIAAFQAINAATDPAALLTIDSPS